MDFWDWIFNFASDNKSKWYKNRNLLFFLLMESVGEKNDHRLCLLYSQFKASYVERKIPEKYMLIMQAACKSVNTPDTLEIENNRIDWKQLNTSNDSDN